MEKIIQSEDVLQSTCFLWWNKHFRRVSYLFAVPNGGKRSVIDGMKFKATGVKAGVSDLILLIPSGKTYFIEMKITTGVQSDAQKLFQAQIETFGFEYYICYSFADFKQLIYKLLAFAVEPGKRYL